jgi:hypothetical protein
LSGVDFSLASGRYVYVIAEGTQLGLCEVEVYGVTPACPDFCVANPKRLRAINAAHQLAMTSNDMQMVANGHKWSQISPPPSSSSTFFKTLFQNIFQNICHERSHDRNEEWTWTVTEW